MGAGGLGPASMGDLTFWEEWIGSGLRGRVGGETVVVVKRIKKKLI